MVSSTPRRRSSVRSAPKTGRRAGPCRSTTDQAVPKSRFETAAPAGTWGAAVASILLIEHHSGAHHVLRSALGLQGHDVVVAPRHQVQGRYDLALVGRDHVERAREVSKRVLLYGEAQESPRQVCAEVDRLLRS